MAARIADAAFPRFEKGTDNRLYAGISQNEFAISAFEFFVSYRTWNQLFGYLRITASKPIADCQTNSEAESEAGDEIIYTNRHEQAYNA